MNVNDSVLTRKPLTGAASSSGSIKDAAQLHASQPKAPLAADTPNKQYFLSYRENIIAPMKISPKGLSFTVKFSNFRYATDSDHVAEAIQVNLVDRNMARKVERKEYEEFGRPPIVAPAAE